MVFSHCVRRANAVAWAHVENTFTFWKPFGELTSNFVEMYLSTIFPDHFLGF